MTVRFIAAVVVSLAIAGCGSSPPRQQPPPSGEPITGSERIGWNQQASDASELALFSYAIYVDGSRGELAGASCGQTPTDAGFPCSAQLPKMSPGAHTLELAAYVFDGSLLESSRSSPLQVIVSPSVTAGAQLSAAPLTSGLRVQTADGVDLHVEVVATGLEEPTDIAAAPDGRLFVAERAGRIRVVRDGALVTRPAVTLDDVSTTEGRGLLSLVVDPGFDRTHAVYAIYTAATGDGRPMFQLVRYRETLDTLADRAVLLDEIPASPRPSASVRFGPDAKLYAAFDDGGDPSASGDLSSYNGKLLRMNSDGTTPDDQAAATPVFAYEFQSPRGFDWQGSSGQTIWLADGAAGATRLRRVVASGRPLRSAIAATYLLPSLPGTSALVFYRGNLLPGFGGDLLVGSNEGRHILRIRFDPRDPTRVLTTERLLQDAVGGIRALAVGRDGALYFATAHEVAKFVP